MDGALFDVSGLVLPIVLGAVAVLALLFAARCYLELHRWARVMQRGGIAIGYKNKVQLEAPLVELAEWIDALKADDAAGRVIYTARGVRVALLRNRKPPGIELAKPGFRARLSRRRQAAAA